MVTCEEADDQAGHGRDEHRECTVPHVRHLVEVQVPGSGTQQTVKTRTTSVCLDVRSISRIRGVVASSQARDPGIDSHQYLKDS